MSTMAKHIGQYAHKLAWHRKEWLRLAKYHFQNQDETNMYIALFILVSNDGELK
jgi:hypothetical protein